MPETTQQIEKDFFICLL